MSGAFRALLTRDLARLAADRVAVTGGLVLVAALGLGATAAATALADAAASDRAAEFRLAAWTRGSGLFDALLAILAVTLGANGIHGEIRRGTLFGVLARPVSRVSVYLSRWLASAVALAVAEAVRSGTWIAAACWLEGRLDPTHVAGAVAGFTGHLLLLAAFAALGAVLPPGYALLAGTGGLAVTGLAFSGLIGGPARRLVDAVASFLPLALHQGERVLEALCGGAAGPGAVGEIIAYRLSWTVLMLTAGAWAFARRDLAPRG